MFTSTDLVFDGTRPWNREDDPVGPLSEYGRTKVRAERIVLAIPTGVVARLSLLYGWSRSNSRRLSFFDQAVRAVRSGESRSFFEDEYRTPLDLATAALILVRLAESDFAGLVHVAGPERMSRFELMRRASACLGLEPSLIQPSRVADARSARPQTGRRLARHDSPGHALPKPDLDPRSS